MRIWSFPFSGLNFGQNEKKERKKEKIGMQQDMQYEFMHK